MTKEEMIEALRVLVDELRNEFHIGSVLYETDKPYYLNCWKVVKGSDLLYMRAGDESLRFDYLSEKDFSMLWSIVCKFFGFPEVRYEQMDLFSCLGV